MFPIAAPNLPPTEAPVMIALTDQAKQSDNKTHKLGVCMVVSNFRPLPPLGVQGAYVVDTEADSALYFINHENRDVSDKVTTVVLKNAMHGTLNDDGNGAYVYFPNPDYVGKDTAIIEVDRNGLKVQVTYYFHDVSRGVDSYEDDYTCGKQGRSWKISSGSSGNTDIDAFARHLLLVTRVALR